MILGNNDGVVGSHGDVGEVLTIDDVNTLAGGGVVESQDEVLTGDDVNTTAGGGVAKSHDEDENDENKDENQLRRSIRTRKPTYKTIQASVAKISVPQTYRQAVNSPNAAHWKSAME